jgi:aryl-alcohol dehydrogenase-like predicted oxidoreductase
MEVRTIGSLAVPVIGLGCNQFGTAICDKETSIGIINEALDAGVSYFDIADEYGQNYFDRSDPHGWGGSEELLGEALEGHRHEVIIATKFGAHPHDRNVGSGGNSARWARAAIEGSLRRLRTDYIDLYQVHFPDPDVPIDETLAVLNDFVGEGKVREIGCCNFTAELITEAADTAKVNGYRPFASAQNVLNLLQRKAMTDLLPTCERLGVAIIPYYPLASGMLTGKYRRGSELPVGTRLTDGVMLDEAARNQLFSEKMFGRLEALEDFAATRGHTLLELAFAWLLAQPAVGTVIAGAARAGQAAANAMAGNWRISHDEAMAAVEALLQAA